MKLGLIAAGFILGCDAPCILPPCAAPMAIFVTVSSTGGPVSGATLNVTGPASSAQPCNAECAVPGTAGTYHLTLSAPGFQTIERTLVVDGSNPRCGCPIVETERISLVMSPVA